MENDCSKCGQSTYGRVCKDCRSRKTQSDPSLLKREGITVYRSCAECGIPFRLGFRGSVCTPCRLYQSRRVPEMKALVDKPPTSHVLKIREKYMNPIPSALACLVNYMNVSEPLPGWQQAAIDEIKTKVQYCLHAHLESSVLSRQRFHALAPEYWQDDSGMVRLTENPRKILGHFPARVLVQADDLCSNYFKEHIEDYRLKLENFMHVVQASEADRVDLARLLARDSFMMSDVEAHRAALDKWRRMSLTKQNAIIGRLCKAEGFAESLMASAASTARDSDNTQDERAIRTTMESPIVKAVPQAIWA